MAPKRNGPWMSSLVLTALVVPALPLFAAAGCDDPDSDPRPADLANPYSLDLADTTARDLATLALTDMSASIEDMALPADLAMPLPSGPKPFIVDDKFVAGGYEGGGGGTITDDQ